MSWRGGRGPRRPREPIEQRVRSFVQRNSGNGYFTRVSTLPQKFGISEERAWEIVGELLADGSLDSVDDRRTGEMKLCGPGQEYAVLGRARERRRSGDGGQRRGGPGRSRDGPRRGGRAGHGTGD